MVAQAQAHALMIGAELHRPFHFEGADPGAVGAGMYWLDTTVAPHRLWRRDGANLAWVAVAPGDAETIRDTIGAALAAGPGVRIAVDDPGDAITVEAMARNFAHQQAAGTAASSSSGTVWSTWLTTTRVLPAGTWEAAATFAGLVLVTAANGAPSVRVAAPFAAAALNHGVMAQNSRNPAGCVGEGSFVSDGSTPTEFRVEYRRNDAAGGTATVTAEHGTLAVQCRRTGP